jgi:hypothetical protein
MNEDDLAHPEADALERVLWPSQDCEFVKQQRQRLFSAEDWDDDRNGVNNARWALIRNHLGRHSHWQPWFAFGRPSHPSEVALCGQVALRGL